MGLKWDIDDLSNLADFATRIGVHPQTMRNWAKSANFPQPVLYRYKLYSNEALILWVRHNGLDEIYKPMLKP